MSGTIVVWGAGRIGRGFIADLFHAVGKRQVETLGVPNLWSLLGL